MPDQPIPQTDFRPQLHGFDFDNTWDRDDNYRNFVKQKLLDAAPIVVKIIVTNPLLGGALLGALGAAYGIGEALLPGIFDTIIIPGIINQIVGEVNDKIESFLPDHYGACGGMAYASLDYYYYQWMIPKGIYVHPDNPGFDVPPNDDQFPDAQLLRTYIYTRLEDSYDAGGVLNTMLEWYIILKTLPSQIGGGGKEIQNRTKPEWVKLAGLLDQGKPQPLALIFDVDDIFDNHQLVAYGYGGDPNAGTAFIYIYDNNFPNEERVVRFDFMGSELNGVIANFTDGIKESGLKGFFCIEYTPKMPPVSWYLTQGLSVSPSLRQSTGAIFDVKGAVQNAFSFFQPFKNPDGVVQQKAWLITPLIVGVLDYHTTITKVDPEEENAFADLILPFEANVSFDLPGSYVVFAKIQLAVLDQNFLVPLNDVSGQVLSRIFFLPVANTKAINYVQFTILPPLTIVPYNPDAIACYSPYAEGGNLTLIVANNPFATANLRYDWSVENIDTGDTHLAKFELFNLPAADTVFTVKVTITDNDDGSQASGSLKIKTYTQQDASRTMMFCKLHKILNQFIIPVILNPFGPDDAEFRNYIEQNIREIDENAKQVIQLGRDLDIRRADSSQ